MAGEQHYDEETLLSFLAQDHPTAEHFSDCSECREKLDSFRLIAGALADEATWDETALSDTPNLETIATLRAFADRMADEDAQAALYLQDLLDGTREMWMANLRHHPEYRTPGVVRKLIEALPSALDTMPRDAVELTAVATEIADHLDPTAYTADTVARLRGAAWRERAYALFYTGDYAAAERALCASESHFTESSVNEYDLARVGVVRALVERGLERYSSAVRQTQISGSVFARYEDKSKTAAAQIAEVHLLFSSGRLDDAYAVLTKLKHEFQSARDENTYALILGNLGNCCWRMGRVDESLLHHEAAASLLGMLGVESEAVRERWNVARVLTYAGRLDDAIIRLRAVRTEFERLGMMASAIQVDLDIAEIQIICSSFDEVEEICRNAVHVLRDSRLEYTAPALTALGLMQEAAKNRTATPAFVREIREYFRRMPDSPRPLFAFPSD